MLLLGVLGATRALARVGGGESYTSGRDFGDGDGDGGIPGALVEIVVWLLFRHPQIGCPLLLVCGVAYYFHQRSHNPTARTQKAFEQREAERRTEVSPEHVTGWVNALKRRDPSFQLEHLLDNARSLFLRTQEAWFKRDLAPVRPFLSDATYKRLQVQLELLRRQGVRDAMADVQVLDVKLIGLDQNEWFDSIHLRIRAQLRDAEAPASATDEQALAAARQAPVESFTEVWTFVRKPGVQTRIGHELYQGKCPNCGAPYKGGATSNCEYCGAIVNSGNYDWTLSEITQGIEHVKLYTMVDGLLEARQRDAALNLEMLEDRTSLVFWKWVDAQSQGTATPMAKLALPEYVTQLEGELSELKNRGRRKVFLDCAVGGVITRMLRSGETLQEAHVEVRWSARMAIGPIGEQPPPLPTIPQRWVFTLVRNTHAQTPTKNGMSTSRCLNCNAPLTDSGSTTCDFCGADLSHGDRDWVLQEANTYERWDALEMQRHRATLTRKRMKGGPGTDFVPDVQERERLLFMMASLAAADGQVESRELSLLKLCAERWSVDWAKVEMALNAGPQLFDRLVPKGSPEAESFLRELVQMALVDGKIDRREKQLLQAAAHHLGVPEKLAELIAR